MEWQAALALSIVLVVASITDLATRRIPNRLTAAAGLVGLGLASLEGFPVLFSGIGASLLFGIPLLALSLLRPGSFGMGDVKLIAVMGLFMGWAVWPSLLAGLGLATAYGFARGMAAGAPAATVTLPLAPFLAVGVALVWAAGSTMLQ